MDVPIRQEASMHVLVFRSFVHRIAACGTGMVGFTRSMNWFR